MENFIELLIEELQDLYDAELQIVNALPKMQKEASTPELKQAFKDHLQETKNHVTRLEKAFQLLDAPIKKMTCKAVKGLIAEAEEMMQKHRNAMIKDAAMIGAAQKVEHYEMAGYGTARAHANLLEMDEIADLLTETLEEESHANKMLTKIAEGSIFSGEGVNKKALKSKR